MAETEQVEQEQEEQITTTSVRKEAVEEFMRKHDFDDEEIASFWEGSEEEPEPAEPAKEEPGEFDLLGPEPEPEGGWKITVPSGAPVFQPPGGLDLEQPEPKAGEEEMSVERLELLEQQWQKQALPKFEGESLQTLKNIAGKNTRLAHEAEQKIQGRLDQIKELGNVEVDSDPELGKLSRERAELIQEAERAKASLQEAERRGAFAKVSDEALQTKAQDLLIAWEEAEDAIAQIPRLSRHRRAKAEAERDEIFIERARITSEIAERAQDQSLVSSWLGLAQGEVIGAHQERLKDEAVKATKAVKEAEREDTDPDRLEELRKEANRANFRARKGPTPEEVWKDVRARFGEYVKSREPREPVRGGDMSDYLDKGPVHN